MNLPDHLRCYGCGAIGDTEILTDTVLVHCEKCDAFTAHPTYRTLDSRLADHLQRVFAGSRP